jgi:uncharacterized protein
MALKEKYKQELLDIIQKHVPCCTIYLFGSRALDQERVGSDIDIALDSGTCIDRDKLLAIEIDIDETSIPMKIDLVDFQKASDELKKDILREGIRWKK